MKPEPAGPGPEDARALGAMSRVLEAERAAEAQLAAIERRCQQDLEEARAARRALLERVQQRIVVLHERAATARESRASEILTQSRQSPASTPAAPSPERLNAALERLVTQLLSSDAPDGADGPHGSPDGD